MAEVGENYGMRDKYPSEDQDKQGEDETNFGGREDDDQYRDPNRSINVIDTRNPNYSKKKQPSPWESDTIPNPR